MMGFGSTASIRVEGRSGDTETGCDVLEKVRSEDLGELGKRERESNPRSGR